ncbi:MAG: small multi-drug export protein [Clostridia bacterium]|nr:small multi-drug export protein [Clostridia bacterium]
MKEFIEVLLLSMVPLIEQRGAIPLGIIIHDLNPLAVFAVSFIGSLAPVPFILFFFSYIFDWLGKTKLLKWFYDYIDRKVRKGRDKVEKYEKWGLIIFVAIPLPTTGLWTGSAIAAFLKMDKKKAALYILTGGLISAAVITLLSIIFPALLGYKG